ncbi:hypothetical protein GCM10009641_84340 [Mycobacterium cookii]
MAELVKERGEVQPVSEDLGEGGDGGRVVVRRNVVAGRADSHPDSHPDRWAAGDIRGTSSRHLFTSLVDPTMMDPVRRTGGVRRTTGSRNRCECRAGRRPS